MLRDGAGLLTVVCLKTLVLFIFFICNLIMRITITVSSSNLCTVNLERHVLLLEVALEKQKISAQELTPYKKAR